jgi:hypothetical protein
MEEGNSTNYRRTPFWVKGWFRDVAAGFLLVALVLLLHWRILTPDLGERHSLDPGDFTAQFYAFDRAEAKQLRSGQLPLWEPCMNSGHPFLADVQAAVFYPISFLTVLSMAWGGDSLFALELEVVAHFCLAAIFTYLFARRTIRHRGGAFLSACAFVFGGYLTGYPSLQLAILKTDVWLPLILLGLEAGVTRLETAARHAWLPFLGAGLAYGLAILAGHPQSAMYVGYASIGYLLFRLWGPSLRRRLPPALALFFLAALGLSAAQWLPSLEYMRLSTRATVSYQEASNGLALTDLLQLVLPSQSALYVGVVPLLLAALALPLVPRRPVRFWIGLGLVALLLAFGGNLFFYSVFYLLVPGFGLFRGQERAAFLVSYALAMLGGYGLAGLCRRPLPRWAPKVVAAACLGALGWICPGYIGWLAAGQANYSPFYWSMQQGVYLFLCLAGALVLVSWRGRGGSARWFVVGMLFLTLLDLFTANASRNQEHRLPVELVAPSALIEKMQADDGLFRVHNDGQFAANLGCQYDLEATGGPSPLRLERYSRFYWEVPKEFVWRLLNVRYVVSPNSALHVPSEVVATESRDEELFYLHRLATTAPRAWVVHEVEIIPEEGDALARLSDWRFDPFGAAVLPAALEAPLGPTDSQAAPSVVHWIGREPARLELTVELPADGLLVLSEVYYPGWRATVDGRPVEILRADVTLRALRLAAGQHVVELAYRPYTVAIGLVISAVTLLLCLGLGLWSVVQHARASAHL